ncbi:MAG TPA: hypothetical protein VLC52_03415 [Anaerolineae bacterium]|nr:hypothetical protein [Anaerolineae bacterium]
MTAATVAPGRARFWKTALLLGAVHFLVMTFGLVVEAYSGGCMFVIPAYFMVLPVAISILLLRRVGAGAAVFLPYAVLGFPPTYYFEWQQSHALWGVWGVFAWCLIGPLVGLAGDLAYRFLPRSLPERWRAVATGAVLGAAIYLTTYLALAALYRRPELNTHFRFFTEGAWFSVPWLVVNGGFAGYTGYALTRRV